MQLKTFDATNCPSTRAQQSKPIIGMDTKVGLFRFNKAACELIGLKDKSSIKLHQDEQEEGDWYVEVVEQGGFELRAKENVVPNGVMFNSTAIAKLIAVSVAFEDRSGRLLIGKEPVLIAKRKLWPLITASLKNA